MGVYDDLLDALEEHTLATIENKESEGCPDTRNGRFNREQSKQRLQAARSFVFDELATLKIG